MLRLKSLARMIEVLGYRTVLRRVRESTDRHIRGTRMRHPGKGREGNKLEVYDRETGELVFEHNAAQTYRCNQEVMDWIDKQIQKNVRDNTGMSMFVCPYHGRIDDEKVTTMKTCGRCMEEMGIDAGSATLLAREPYQGHDPRWQYDCARCRFAWCCGPQCACNLSEAPAAPPKERAKEVRKAIAIWKSSKARRGGES